MLCAIYKSGGFTKNEPANHFFLDLKTIRDWFIQIFQNHGTIRIYPDPNVLGPYYQ
jgi:hypothetical protein